MNAQNLYEYLGAIPERQHTDLTVRFSNMTGPLIVKDIATVKTEPETKTLWLVAK